MKNHINVSTIELLEASQDPLFRSAFHKLQEKFIQLKQHDGIDYTQHTLESFQHIPPLIFPVLTTPFESLDFSALNMFINEVERYNPKRAAELQAHFFETRKELARVLNS